MWYAPKVTSTTVAEPVSVDDVKAQSVVDSGDDDAVLLRLIKTARDHVERYCGIRLCEQTVELRSDSVADLARLPIGPVQSVTSIAYVDLDGATQTLADTVYQMLPIDALEASITLKFDQVWPTIRAGSLITVTVVAGFEDIPPAITGAILLFIADGYQQRENDAAAEWTAFDALLCNFRRGV